MPRSKPCSRWKGNAPSKFDCASEICIVARLPYGITNIVITLHIDMKAVSIERVEVQVSSKRPVIALHLSTCAIHDELRANWNYPDG